MRSVIAPARELLDGLDGACGGTCKPLDEGGLEDDADLGYGCPELVAVPGRLFAGEPTKLRPEKVFNGEADTGLCPGPRTVRGIVSGVGAEGRLCCEILIVCCPDADAGKSMGREPRC